MLRILVIDDSLLMRRMSTDQLAAAGYVVDAFLPGSAMEVAEKVRAWKPDLVLSDLQMPQVDGVTVARTVRQVDASIPVVILTANRDPGRESVLRTMGVRRVLHKPLSGEALIQALEEVLARE